LKRRELYDFYKNTIQAEKGRTNQGLYYAFGQYAHSGKEGVGKDTNTVLQKYKEEFRE
jgi:hypothetical protein